MHKIEKALLGFVKGAESKTEIFPLTINQAREVLELLHSANTREALSAQFIYQCRELGRPDWVICDKGQYEYRGTQSAWEVRAIPVNSPVEWPKRVKFGTAIFQHGAPLRGAVNWCDGANWMHAEYQRTLSRLGFSGL